MRSVVALVVAVAAGLAAPAFAHDVRIALPAKRFVLKLPSNARARRLVVNSGKGALVHPAHDPRTDGAAFFLRTTGATPTRTPLVSLDPTRWGLQKGRFVYRDASGRRGGVRKMVLGGGRVSIVAKGAGVPAEVDGPIEALWMHLRVGDEWWCMRLGSDGPVSENRAGAVVARDVAAVGSCPDAVCGNGALERGEYCDDGNLVDDDGCASDCAVGVCEGQTFESTWEAIDRLVFERGGCRQPQCHGRVDGEGGLDLRSDVAFANLVDQPAENGVLDLVEPGDQDLSMLYLKLAAATLPDSYRDVPGTPMPSGGLPPLEQDVLEGLRLWIRAGAPKSGVVEGTATRFDACLPPPDPLKIPPLDPPAPGDGIQLHAPPWPLPAHSENEVCYATYYDATTHPGGVPASAETPCPPEYGGASVPCFRYHATELAQDPQSHHSIIAAYTGAEGPTNPAWGAWTCKGGPSDGSRCNPEGFGVPAPDGADCGEGGGCSTPVVSSVACFGFGPSGGVPQTLGGGFAGSQEPLARQTFADGVYNVLPVRGTIVWNSHAFNLTNQDSTMEQYLNLTFATPEHQVFPVQTVFPILNIFAMSVPPFATQEVCATVTYPRGSRVFELSSHVHKRGKLFRIWGPPQQPCNPGPSCTPDVTTPLYISTAYSDPVRLPFDPPVALDSVDAEQRTYKYCAVYDNGASDPTEVKRCGDQPCTVVGGNTTEDEMFLMLSSYYIDG